MKFVESNYAGKQCWQIDRWRDAGFAHAFLGAEVDVRESREPFEQLASAGAPFSKLRTLRQVHGVNVLLASDSVAPAEGDAWFVDLGLPGIAGTAFGIRTADCLPVILRSRDGAFASCVHSGWRGSVGRVVTAAIRHFEQAGVATGDLEVAIGPGARGCCYEIGAELVAAFERCFADYRAVLGSERELVPPLRKTAQSIYVDNAALVTAELLSLGVPDTQIAVFEGCTICDSRFFSFRREKELSGRQVSVLGVPRERK